MTVALEHDLVDAACRSYYNLAYVLFTLGRIDDARATLEEAIHFARRRGNRSEEHLLRSAYSEVLAAAGEWDEALATRVAAEGDAEDVSYLADTPVDVVQLLLARGERQLAAQAAEAAPAIDHVDLQARHWGLVMRAIVAADGGDHDTALRRAREAHENLRTSRTLMMPFVPETLVALVEASVATGQLDVGEEALDELVARPPGERTQSLDAHEARLRALLERARGQNELVDGRLRRAAALFREVGIPFWLAVTLLEHGEWLTESARPDEAEPLVREAREIFERLGARPWLERATAVGAREAATAAEV